MVTKIRVPFFLFRHSVLAAGQWPLRYVTPFSSFATLLAGGQWPLRYVTPFLLRYSGLAGGQWPLRYVPPSSFATLALLVANGH